MTSTTQYLQLPSGVDVRMVDDAASLQHAQQCLLSADVDAVGLDMECYPGFVSGRNTAALLQIATRESAFLIDLLCYESVVGSCGLCGGESDSSGVGGEVVDLGADTDVDTDNDTDDSEGVDVDADTDDDTASDDDTMRGRRRGKQQSKRRRDPVHVNCGCKRGKVTLDGVLDVLLSSPRVAKLGFGLSEDLRELRRAFPQASAFSSVSNSIDLNVPKLFSSLPPLPRRSSGSGPGGKGLSKLCHDQLGFALRKDQQMSNWRRRPLNDSQVHYAALDAFCCVQLFDRLLAGVAEESGSEVAEVRAQLERELGKDFTLI